MTNRPLIIETPASAAGVLRVEFTRTSDRYSHHIFVVRGGSAQLVLSSEEGTPEDYWPPGPPLQQLSIEDRGPLQVALGVGMAGSSHWSMSVETSPAQLIFDVACRKREEPQWLGSKYTATAETSSLVTVAPVAIQSGGGRISGEVSTSGLQIQIAAASAGATAQWKYAINLTS